MNEFVYEVTERKRSDALTPSTRVLQPSAGPMMFDYDALVEGEGGAFNLREVWRILFRWRFLIAATTAVSLLVALATTLMTVPLFKATSSVEVTQQQAQLIRNSDVAPVAIRDPQYLATQYGLIRSRALIERVVHQLNLGTALKMPGRTREAREQAAADLVGSRYSVQPVIGSRLINLNYVDSDPRRAATIVNAFGDAFIASQIERKFNETAYARQFLQDRLASTKKALEGSEAALVAYAQREHIVMVGGGGGGPGNANTDSPGSGATLDTSSMVALNTALSAAEGDRIAAEQRYRQGQTNASGDVQRDATIQDLRSQRGKLQADYDQKLTLYLPEFPAMVQLRGQIAAIDRQLQARTTAIAQSLRSDFAAAAGREQALRARVAQLKGSVLDVRERSVQYNILQREVDTNRTLYDALLQRYKEIGVAGNVGASSVAIVDRARTPTAPFTPNLSKSLLLALFMGLGLGVALAYLIEFIDDTVKAPEDVKNKLHVPVLGVIPIAPKGTTVAEQLADPQSAVSEAYFSVSAAIQFSTSGGAPRSLMVSSTQSAEGKSNTSYAIAQNFARLDRTVLLIDADMRKPSLFLDRKSNLAHEEGDNAAKTGLSALLTSDSSLASHVGQTRMPNLFLLPSGRVPPNPAELLASHRMKAILDEALSQFDMVIIDTPPVLGLADAPLIASMCQAVVLIVQSGATRRPAINNTINRLRSTGGHIIGAVLTKFDPKASAYGYGYGYGYGGDAYKYGAPSVAAARGQNRILLS